MENIYHVTYKKIATHYWEMPHELEKLAQMLVKAGRLRIDADEAANFVRFSLPESHVHIVFSYRELCDVELIPRTNSMMKDLLGHRYRGAELEDEVSRRFHKLQHEVRKILGISSSVEIRLARAMVQAAHPAVILLHIAEGAELFISYSHNVGDMMDIRSWQAVGDSSGLQSIGPMENAVFVSCNGDPLLPENKKRHEGEGLNALSRMIVIAGQELGHFSDIKRSKNGRYLTRYSTNISSTKAKPEAAKARFDDIERVKKALQRLEEIGAKDLAILENSLKFFRDKKRKDITVLNTSRRVNNKTRSFLHRLGKLKLSSFAKIPPYDTPYYASKMLTMCADMAFNLEPKADAYSREDPIEEEAIACVEALARVPQQVNKWGHINTRILMPNLYKIYYGQVIPGCIEAYENLSGNKYKFRITKKSWLQQKWEKRFYKGE